MAKKQENTPDRKPLFQDDFDEQSLQGLYRRMKKTAKARFNCARRLRLHHDFTVWSLTLFSSGLLIMSVGKEFGLPISVSEGSFLFIQFSLGLLILIISLLLNSSSTSDRAEKMHRCALEINELTHQILPACRLNEDFELYNKTQFRYSNILNSYENHIPLDFAMAKIDMNYHYGLSKMECFQIRCRYILKFWIHILLFIVLLTAFVVAFYPESKEENKQANKSEMATPRKLSD